MNGVSKDTNVFFMNSCDQVCKETALSVSRWSRYSKAEKPIRYVVFDTRELPYSHVLSVTSEIKKTFIVTTVNGYKAEFSEDTEVMIEDGTYIPVSSLQVGDKIVVNGIPDERYKDYDTMRRWYVDEHRTQKKIAEMCSHDDSHVTERTIRAWVKKFNLGRGDSGAVYGEDNPKYKGDNIGFKGGYSRTHFMYDTKLDLTKCTRCGSTEGPFQIHHEDRNTTNTSEDNLEVLCRLCHYMEHHGAPVRHMSFDHIESVMYGGMQKVYNITTESGNYVADGFIVKCSNDEL